MHRYYFNSKLNRQFNQYETKFTVNPYTLLHKSKHSKPTSITLNKTHSDHALQPAWRCPTSDEVVNHLFTGSAVSQIEGEFTRQLESVYKKIIEVENSNRLMEDTIGGMATTIATFMSEGKYVDEWSPIQVNGDITDDIENAIECMQHEIDRIKNISFIDGKKMIVMNRQLNVLSAKYVDFNEKIHKHLNEYNRQNTKQVDTHKIIDSDMRPFSTSLHHNNNKSSHNRSEQNKRNYTPNRRENSNHSAKRHNMSAYSKYVKLQINDAIIYDLISFKSEFKNAFESILGVGMVHDLFVNAYRMEQGIISSIDVMIALKSPLNYEYMNNFKYPDNRRFFPYQMMRLPKKRDIAYEPIAKRREQEINRNMSEPKTKKKKK